MKRIFVLLMMILPLALVACSRDNVTDVERNPEGGVDVTFELSQAEVDTIIQTAVSASANPAIHNPSVDLQPGRIVINGDRTRLNGSGSDTGSITITVSVQDGRLLFQATEVTFDGMTAGDAGITELNNALTNGFNTRANRENPENRNLTYQSVSVSDGSISLVINLKRLGSS